MKPIHIHDCEKCIFLGNDFDEEMKKEVDLYYCPANKPDEHFNLIIRYGKYGDYISGVDSFLRDSINLFLKNEKKETMLTKTLNLVIEKKLESIKKYYIGLSEKKAEENKNIYYNSSYYKNRPDDEIKEDLSFEEFQKSVKERQEKIEKYEQVYLSQEKLIPPDPFEVEFFFKNKEDMLNYCHNEECIELNAVSKNHAKIIYDSLNLKNKFITRVLKNS